MYIYTPLCRYWIALYRYVLVFIVPHVDIELEDNKQFILNIPRITTTKTVDRKVVVDWHIFLTFTIIWANSVHDNLIFSYTSQKIGIDMSWKLSP